MSDDTHDQRAEWLAKADILTEALPYMRRFAGQTFVIKSIVASGVLAI